MIFGDGKMLDLQLKTRSSSSIGRAGDSAIASCQLDAYKIRKKNGPLDIRDVRLATGMGCSPIFF